MVKLHNTATVRRRWLALVVLALGALLLWLAFLAFEGADQARPAVVGPAAELPLQWSDEQVLARGPAHIGPWRMNDSDWRYVDDVTVAITDSGVVGLAWVDQARKAVMLQVHEADGTPRFDEPVDVSRSPDTFSWLPRIAFGDTEGSRMHVLWQEIVFSGGSHGGEIFHARSLDGGRSFEATHNLSGSPAGAGKGRLSARRWHNGSLDLQLGPRGAVWVAWTEYEGALRVARSVDHGASFSSPLHVAGGGTQPARAPSLAAAGDTVALAWAVGEDPSADIHMAVSADGGRSFSDAVAIAGSAGHADAPSLEVDSSGRWHLVFTEREAGPGGVPHLRYGTADDPYAAFDAKRLPTGAGGGAAYASLAVDETGRAFLAWEHYPQPADRPRGLGFAMQAGAGERFAVAQPLLVPEDGAFNGSLQGALGRKLAVAAGGNVAVVNSHFAPGRGSEVRLLHGRTPAAAD